LWRQFYRFSKAQTCPFLQLLPVLELSLGESSSEEMSDSQSERINLWKYFSIGFFAENGLHFIEQFWCLKYCLRFRSNFTLKFNKILITNKTFSKLKVSVIGDFNAIQGCKYPIIFYLNSKTDFSIKKLQIEKWKTIFFLYQRILWFKQDTTFWFRETAMLAALKDPPDFVWKDWASVIRL